MQKNGSFHCLGCNTLLYSINDLRLCLETNVINLPCREAMVLHLYLSSGFYQNTCNIMTQADTGSLVPCYKKVKHTFQLIPMHNSNRGLTKFTNQAYLLKQTTCVWDHSIERNFISWVYQANLLNLFTKFIYKSYPLNTNKATVMTQGAPCYALGDITSEQLNSGNSVKKWIQGCKAKAEAMSYKTNYKVFEVVSWSF